MANENLLATIEAVKNSNYLRWKRTPYQNRQDVWGWHFSFWYAYSYHLISIHNCPTWPSQRSIADAIEGIEAILETKWGVYANKKIVPGFYATARSTRPIDGCIDHWFMIGRSAEKNFRSLLLCKSSLEPEEEDILQYLANKSAIDWQRKSHAETMPKIRNHSSTTNAGRIGLYR
jgi:hypothetical protein